MIEVLVFQFYTTYNWKEEKWFSVYCQKFFMKGD